MIKSTLFLAVLTLSGLVACGAKDAAQASEPATVSAEDRVVSTDSVLLPTSEWHELLSTQEYNILREAGTERSGSSELLGNHADGVYVCGACGLPLFDSETKFESGTGWPSFYQPIADGRVENKEDRTMGMSRTENRCERCSSHLGHVFNDGPEPTGKRFCMNGASLDFVPRDQVAQLGSPPKVMLGGYPETPANNGE